MHPSFIFLFLKSNSFLSNTFSQTYCNFNNLLQESYRQIKFISVLNRTSKKSLEIKKRIFKERKGLYKNQRNRLKNIYFKLHHVTLKR